MQIRNRCRMDYSYIEQLIERYFAAETSLQEEHILREFFVQDNVPAHLRRWQPLFAAQHALAGAHLDQRFDARVLSRIGSGHTLARRISIADRMRPLFKAAAFVAFAVVIGTAVEHASPGSDVPTSGLQAAFEGQDELDPDEATPLDIRSANVSELSDSAEIFAR